MGFGLGSHQGPTHNLTPSCEQRPWRCAAGLALGDSIPFSLHRDEGLKELKEQNWEVPLQDGEASGPGGPCCDHQAGRRALGHWTSLMMCYLLSRTPVPDLPRSRAVRGAVGGQCGGESLSSKPRRSSRLRPAPWPSKHAVAGAPGGAGQWPAGQAQPPGEAHAGGGTAGGWPRAGVWPGPGLAGN